MFHKNIEAHSKEETHFEMVCRLAKAKDENALTQLAAEGFCLHTFQGEYDPVMFLAEQGYFKSVELLINRFKASPNHAVEGAARGKHISQVKQLIIEGASRHFTVRGYAFAGDEEQVNQLIKQGASAEWAAEGAARGRQVKLVNKLIKESENPFRTFHLLVHAAKGYGFVQNAEQLDQLIAQQDREPQRIIRYWAIYGAAEGKHAKLVNQLLEQQDHNTARNLSHQYAAMGYAFAGDAKQVKQLIAGETRPCWAVKGYARGGHVKQMKQLIKNEESCEMAVNEAAFGGHVELVNQLIMDWISYQEQKNQPAEDEKIYRAATKGYESGDHLKWGNILRLMSFTENKELRNSLAVKVKELYSELDMQALLKQAARLNKIMREYSLDFKQAQALTIRGTRGWLLQGDQLVTKRIIPAEMFIWIASFVAGLSIPNTIQLLEAVEKKFSSTSLGLFSAGKSGNRKQKEPGDGLSRSNELFRSTC